MVSSARIGFDDTFHLQMEKHRHNLSHGYCRLDGNDILSQVVVLPKHIHHMLFLRRKVRKQLSLYPLRPGSLQGFVMVPSHSLYEVQCRGDESGSTIADKIITASTIGCPYGSGKSIDIAAIFFGDTRGDESTAFSSTLYEDRGITDTCRDAIPAHEIQAVGFAVRHILREEASMVYHRVGNVAMGWRIEGVKTVCQYGYGIETIVERSTVGMDIDAIGQSADNKDIGAERPKVGNEMANQVLSIARTMARAHDIDDMSPVKVGVTLVEEHQRSVSSLLETVGVGIIIEA